MQLSEAQLEAACLAAARFVEEDYDRGLNAFGQYNARRQMRDWLTPCLLLLPQTVTPEELEQGQYEALFMEAALPFLLHTLRRREIFDNDSDEDLYRRVSVEEVEEAADNLAYLTMIGLEAALSHTAPLVIPQLSSMDTAQASIDETFDWDSALRQISD